MCYDSFKSNSLTLQHFANAGVTVSITHSDKQLKCLNLTVMEAATVQKNRLRTSLPAIALAACWLLASTAMAQPFGYSVNSDSRSASEAEIDNLYLIDLATGDAMRIGPVGFLDVEGLAFSPDGILFGADDESNSLIQINTETGAAAAVGGQANNLQLDPTQVFDFGLTFRCSDDQPILSSDNLQQLLMSDLSEDGRAIIIGNTSNVPITGLATLVSDGEEQIYGLGAGTSPNLYMIDSITGQATLIGPLQNAASYTDAGVAFDEDGQLWAITDRTSVGGGETLPSQILRIDITTGSATVVAETIDGIESLAISAPDCDGMDGDGSVNEPVVDVPTLSLYGLLALALALVLLSGYYLRKHY